MPGVALPEVLVRVDEAFEQHDDAGRLRRIGDVPDLVTRVAERAQQVDLALVRARQRAAAADARHLRAAVLAFACFSGNVREVARLLRIGHVDDRRAVAVRPCRSRDCAACRRDGRCRRSSGRPAGGWWAGRRFAPAGRRGRRAPCRAVPPCAVPRPRRTGRSPSTTTNEDQRLIATVLLGSDPFTVLHRASSGGIGSVTLPVAAHSAPRANVVPNATCLTSLGTVAQRRHEHATHSVLRRPEDGLVDARARNRLTGLFVVERVIVVGRGQHVEAAFRLPAQVGVQLVGRHLKRFEPARDRMIRCP